MIPEIYLNEEWYPTWYPRSRYSYLIYPWFKFFFLYPWNLIQNSDSICVRVKRSNSICSSCLGLLWSWKFDLHQNLIKGRSCTGLWMRTVKHSYNNNQYGCAFIPEMHKHLLAVKFCWCNHFLTIENFSKSKINDFNEDHNFL